MRDQARGKAKAQAKKRKEELRKQKAAMETMSVAKRRHMQDKGMLAKGAPKK